MNEEIKKDTLVEAKASFASLSTKLNEVCGRAHISAEEYASLSPLGGVKLWDDWNKAKATLNVCTAPAGSLASDILATPSRWSIATNSAVIPSVYDTIKSLTLPSIGPLASLASLEEQTLNLARDKGFPCVTSVASQISTVSDILMTQSDAIKGIIAPVSMLGDLNTIAMQTHKAISESGNLTAWQLGVMDSASYMVDRQIDWTSKYCTTAYGARPLQDIGDFGAYKPKINVVTYLPYELEKEKKQNADITPAEALVKTPSYKLSEKGKRIINKVVTINSILARKNQDIIFKYSGATTIAAATMGGTVCATKNDFGNIIDGLYFIFYENLEHIKTIVTDAAVRNDEVYQCIFRVKHIRTDLRHDYYHGSESKIKKKEEDIADSYNHYVGKPALITADDYLKTQDKLFDEFEGLVDHLLEVV